MTTMPPVLLAEKVFKALSDRTRLRALMLLWHEGELCVCELTYALEEAQPKVSRHLALLRDLGLVAVRRDGLWMFYRLHPDLPSWVQPVMVGADEGTAAAFVDDRRRLVTMAGRPDRTCCRQPEMGVPEGR